MSDELIKRLRERSQGRIKWFAMNRTETAYFIDFQSTWEAGEWMERQKKSSPEWIEREGVHIVEQRVFSELETLAGQAADALESASKDAIRREAFTEAALRASIHSQYPATTEYDRGYAKAREDAAAAIRALSQKVGDQQ